jgi:hypothetical protein
MISIKRNIGLVGEELSGATLQISALAEHYGVSGDSIAKATDAMVDKMHISWQEALADINNGTVSLNYASHIKVTEVADIIYELQTDINEITKDITKQYVQNTDSFVTGSGFVDDKLVKTEKKHSNWKLSVMSFIYFAIIIAMSTVSLVVFFYTLEQFGPTVTGSVIIMGIFLTALSFYFEKVTTGKKVFLHMAVIVQFLTVGTIFVTNLIMFAV